ncbi:MAG: transcriptional regulator, GntR family [Marmoricola sp.]|jgi:GntR family transcriptional repressor for pyruvate dehydrogenase complex|nr:transcriptional regulator, GntR family [Marmoricola sp.]
MPLQPVARRSVPDDVYDQLLTEVVDGAIRPGAALPSERRMAEVLGVSRPAVREALQRLAHVGLVEVRQGDATTVRDFRHHGGLDLLPRLLVHGGEVDLAVARSILEARLYVGPRIAELAAERGGADLDSALESTVRALGEATDPVEKQRMALLFWEHIVEGADSIAFRLMFNGMRAAYEPLIDALAVVMADEVDRVDAYEAVAAAIARSDVTGARLRAKSLLSLATNSLMPVIEQLEEA